VYYSSASGHQWQGGRGSLYYVWFRCFGQNRRHPIKAIWPVPAMWSPRTNPVEPAISESRPADGVGIPRSPSVGFVGDAGGSRPMAHARHDRILYELSYSLGGAHVSLNRRGTCVGGSTAHPKNGSLYLILQGYAAARLWSPLARHWSSTGSPRTSNEVPRRLGRRRCNDASGPTAAPTLRKQSAPTWASLC
jgi:hypothetical protein